MGQFHYPNIPAPRSSTPQNAPEEQEDTRPFSWVPASRRGGVRTMLPTDMPLPLPPVPSHPSPEKSNITTLAAKHEGPTQRTLSLFPAQTQRMAAADRAVSPAPAYVQHEKYTPSETDPDHVSHKLDVESAMASRDRYKSTRSMKAPEVVTLDTTVPLPKKPVIVEPDANPLTPTHTTPAASPIHTRGLMYFPSNSPKEQSTERGGTWKHALCSCADTSTCLTGLFCPCVVYGKTQHRLGLRSEGKDPTNMLGYAWINGSCAVFALLCGCNALLAAIQHTRVRKGYSMAPEAGNVAQDCALALCCCCCTLAQDEKEMKWRESGAKKLNSLGYQNVGEMSYALPAR